MTSGSWSTGASADGAIVVVGVVCSGLLGSFPPSTVEMSLASVVLGALGIFLGRPCFSFLAKPTPEVEDTADSGVGVGVGFASFRDVFGPSNWPPCFRGLISSDAAATGADTVTGVVGVVVAGAHFFTGVSPTVARRLDFRDGVRGSDAISPNHCSVGIAVVEVVVDFVVGTVIVSLCMALQAAQRRDSLRCRRRRRHCFPHLMKRRKLMCTESRIWQLRPKQITMNVSTTRQRLNKTKRV